jgi:hypothetical protein
LATVSSHAIVPPFNASVSYAMQGGLRSPTSTEGQATKKNKLTNRLPASRFTIFSFEDSFRTATKVGHLQATQIGLHDEQDVLSSINYINHSTSE